MAEWKTSTVQFNYHIALDGMYYSVPYQYIKKQVESRLTDTAVEVFYGHEGRKTEYLYLKGIESLRTQLNLDPLIEIIPLKHDSKTSSNPLRLKDEAEEYLKSECTFSNGLDKFILVVDRDKKSFLEKQYDDVLNSMSANADYFFVVSNPCFELWLFLHHNDLEGLDLEFIAENKKSGC